MIICGILFLALSLSSSSSLRFPRSRNSRVHYVQPGVSSLKVDDQVYNSEEIDNSMIRREGSPINTYTGIKKGRKVKDYDVKVLGLDKLKSLELDESLENYLAIDAQDKQTNEKKPLGFKVVNINDFDTDRQKSKLSHHKKVKLVQSLSPPQNFFQKYYPTKIVKKDTTNDKLNFHSTKYTNVYENNRKPRSKSIFDENGMMYLSKPKDVEGRKLTNLINKVMEIKAKQEKHGGLRQPKNDFTRDEMKQIKVIAQAIDEEDRDDDDNKELDQLVLRELLQGEVNEPPSEDDQPLQIVVAQMSPKTKEIEEIKILPKSLRLQDIVGLQADDQSDATNFVTQLISQVLDQKTLDNYKDVYEPLPREKGNAKGRNIASNQYKEETLKQIARALQGIKPETAPELKVDHQFNFEDLVS